MSRDAWLDLWMKRQVGQQQPHAVRPSLLLRGGWPKTRRGRVGPLAANPQWWPQSPGARDRHVRTQDWKISMRPNGRSSIVDCSRMSVLSVVLCVAGLFAAVTPATADMAPIVMDGVYEDWDGIAPILTDAAGDGGSSGIDFGRMWAADDARFFYLRFELGGEILLNDGTSLTLYLDTDMNASTGLAVNGIGAELKWEFGDRDGTFYWSGSSWTVHQDDLRFRAFPSVSANEFEIAFGLHVYPNGSNPLFPGDQVRIFLRDNTGGGDRMPELDETLTYTMEIGSLPPENPLPFGKEEPGDLRITTQNVTQDGPWTTGYGERFGRMYQAVAPEILNFQEIYGHTHVETRNMVESWLPSGPEEMWYSMGNSDCHTVSRYPLAGVWFLDDNLVVLLDTTPVLGTKLLIINAHLPCCDYDEGRQYEVDRILWFLRDAVTEGGSVTLEEDTAILITGDMNFIGLSQQLTSLLTGDIVDEATHGPDFNPDWDGTDLTNLISRMTEKRTAYTWRKDWSYYWPGHLDYMIYSDSVIQPGNHYIVYTPEMSADSLAANGLLSNDSYVSDHLVVCADFRSPFVDSVDGRFDGPGVDRAFQIRLDPNPSWRGSQIEFNLPNPGLVSVAVFDERGRRVAAPFGSTWIELPAGPTTHLWDGRGFGGRRLPAGTYFVRMTGRDDLGRFVGSGKWTVLR